MQRLDISLVIIQKTLDYKKSQRSFASNTNNSKNAQRLAFFWGPGQQFFSLFCICFHLHLHSLFCLSCRSFFFALPVFIFTLRICVAAFGRNDSYFWWLVSLGVSFLRSQSVHDGVNEEDIRCLCVRLFFFIVFLLDIFHSF